MADDSEIGKFSAYQFRYKQLHQSLKDQGQQHVSYSSFLPGDFKMADSEGSSKINAADTKEIRLANYVEYLKR